MHRLLTALLFLFVVLPMGSVLKQLVDSNFARDLIHSGNGATKGLEPGSERIVLSGLPRATDIHNAGGIGFRG